MIKYYVIPSDECGDYAWTKHDSLVLADEEAEGLFRELVQTPGLRVDVFIGDDNEPYTHLDPLATYKYEENL